MKTILYRKIEPIYTASQFTKKTEFRIIRDGYTILTTFHPGDWLIRDQFGEENKISDSDFKKYYARIPEKSL